MCKLLKQLSNGASLMTTDPGDLILDPTCGSGTSAIAAEKWGRRWITSDVSEISVAVARQKLLAQHYDWYVLLDSPEGSRLEHELSGGSLSDFTPREGYGEDPNHGFVYERQRELTAATLAYNIHRYVEFVDRPLIKAGVRRLTSSFTVEADSPYTAEGTELRERDESAEATRERVFIGDRRLRSNFAWWFPLLRGEFPRILRRIFDPQG